MQAAVQARHLYVLTAAWAKTLLQSTLSQCTSPCIAYVKLCLCLHAQKGHNAKQVASIQCVYRLLCVCCAGMPFDIAIRVYLDSFRLPGESQKINRIMESFGARYHKQCPELFKNPDVVYILAYSTIMLNTDQHNSQVFFCLKAHCLATYHKRHVITLEPVSPVVYSS